MQRWWLDAVSEGKQWVALSLPSGAMMPILLRKRWCFRFVLMPRQTQIGGYFGQADSADDIAKAIRSLGHLDYYYQKWPIGQAIALEMQQHGYVVTPQTTYRIEDLSDLTVLEKRFSENKRRQLKKSAALVVDMKMTMDEFYRFHTHCLEQQGKQISYNFSFWETLYTACIAHHAGQIIALRNEAGEVAAACFVVYDSDTCYYLIPTYDSDKGKQGAGARLVMEAIRFAQSHSRTFDFEGSMIPSVAEHYRQFGSQATTYYAVEKCFSPIFHPVLRLYQAFFA